MLKVNKLNKSKVTDPTRVEDVTYLNYLALLGAILLDEKDENYRYVVYNKDLFNKDEERKRLKTIEEIRARGEMTELEKWFKTDKNGKYNEIREKQRQGAYNRIEKMKAEKEKILSKYKDEIVDVSNVPRGGLKNKKIKVININTGDIKIYNTRKECIEDTGIRPTNITTYIRKNCIFQEKYFFTIVDEDKEKIGG